MRLGEVLNKIFRKRKQVDLEEREIAEDIYKSVSDHHQEDDDRFSQIEKNILKEQAKQPITTAKKRWIENINLTMAIVIVVGVLLISLIGVLSVRIANSAFKEDRVKVLITGPEKIKVGELVEYDIVIKNDNRVDLEDVSLNLQLPNNLILKDSPIIVSQTLAGAKIAVGTVKKHGKKKYAIQANVNHNENEMGDLRAEVHYHPTNVSSYFKATAIKNLKLELEKISMLSVGSGTASNGENISLDIIIKNDSQTDYQNLTVSVEYPDGFTYENSYPETTSEKNNNWTIDNLIIGEQYKLTIQGKINGLVDDIKKFNINLLAKNGAVLATTEKSIKIVPSRVLLRQIVKERSVFPGDYLDYKVLFKNNSSTPLRNLIVKTYLPGKYIDRSYVDSRYGYYDSRENILTWRAADYPQLELLEPGEEGELQFRVKLADAIIPKSKDDKNPYTISYSEIESLDVDSPIFENKKIISPKVKTPINSVIRLNSKIEYVSGNDSGGEAKLLVDKESLIKVVFTVSNTTNKLKGVKLTADLPSGVTWKQQIYPEGDNLKFDKRSHQLEWNLGIVDVGTGILSPVEKAEFIIGVTPSVNQVNHGIDLIRDVKIVAKDMFTGNSLKYQFKMITSEMINGLKSGVVRSD